jgi:hypothetical protein
MKITTHGIWHRYTPDKLPPDAPPSAMFLRRNGDGVDWYDYVNSGTHFSLGTIKLSVDHNNVVNVAVLDPARLFPNNAVVLEVFDATVDDPQATFGDKIYDEANQTFNAPPKQDPGPSVADLLKRIEALEGKAHE